MIIMIKIILIIVVTINSPFQPSDFNTESTTDFKNRVLTFLYNIRVSIIQNFWVKLS